MGKPDRYGHCVKCARNLLLPRIVGGKEVMMFTPEFDQTEFVISNKSKMVVCMCKTCKASVDLTDPDVQSDIMDSVKAGWDMEMGVVGLNKPEAKEDIKELKVKKDVRAPKHYNELSILFHSEGIDDYVIQNRLKELGQ